jgi:hypothetical protein
MRRHVDLWRWAEPYISTWLIALAKEQLALVTEYRFHGIYMVDGLWLKPVFALLHGSLAFTQIRAKAGSGSGSYTHLNEFMRLISVRWSSFPQ